MFKSLAKVKGCANAGMLLCGPVPAITRLLYYGGIRLSGLPASHTAFIDAAWPYSPGVGRFNAPYTILSGLLVGYYYPTLTAS